MGLMLNCPTLCVSSVPLINYNTCSLNSCSIPKYSSALHPASHPCLQVPHATINCKVALVHLQVGAGVLGLPSAMSYLGWPGGIIVLVLSCTPLLLAPMSSSGVAPVQLLWWCLAILFAWLRWMPLPTSCSHGILWCAGGRSTAHCANHVQGSSACTLCGSSAYCMRLMGSASIGTMSWRRCCPDLPALPVHVLPVSMLLALSTHHSETRMVS